MKTKRAISLALCGLVAACAGGHNGPGGVVPSPSAVDARGLLGRTVVADAVVLGPSDRDSGRAPMNEAINIAIVLRYRNQDQLNRFVTSVADPGSASFRHYLSNAKFNELFAPSSVDYQRVVTSLKSAGLNVTQIYGNRTVIDATGTVEGVERYFDTQVDRVKQNGESRYANIRAAYAPLGLSKIVLDVEGLDSRTEVEPLYRLIAPHVQAQGLQSPRQRSLLYGPPSTKTGYFGYGPLAFSKAYDFPIVHSSPGATPYDGRGRTAGVVIDADFVDSDIAAYLKYFARKQTGPKVKRVRLKGGPAQPGASSPDSVEATLDVQTILGNAPGVALTVYEIPALANNYITDAYNRVVSDNIVDAVNSSFGGCEVALGRAAVTWSALAEQGVAKGILFSAASGDNGGGLCANAPSSGPYFAAVGGTSLSITNTGSWAAETGWAGSGGGISVSFLEPTWQTGVAGVEGSGRNVPDIALDADPFTGTAFYFTGTWDTATDPLGGTSLASPLYVAAITEMDQLHGGRVGAFGGSLFGFYKTLGTTSAASPYFRDVLEGNNGPFFAGPGYDLVTGLGSIDAWNLSQKL